MSRLAIGILFAFLLVALPTSDAHAQLPIPRHHHPWGRFSSGAWKKVKVITETFENGELASTSTKETTATLIEVDEDEYVLRVEVVVEVAGKRFTADPKIVRQGFFGGRRGDGRTISKIGIETLTINNRSIPTEIRQIVIKDEHTQRVTAFNYSADVAPHVMKRETVTKSLDGKATINSTKLDVLAIEMPYKVLADIHSTCVVRTVSKTNKSTAVTIEIQSNSIPGGVVSHTAKEVDENGKIARRSTLELLDYHVPVDNSQAVRVRPRIFHRTRTKTER